jgi:hypothetical protein
MSIGPVQLLVVGFEDASSKVAIREALGRLRDDDSARLIDAVMVRKHADGSVEQLEYADFPYDESPEAGALVGSLIGLSARIAEEGRFDGGLELESSEHPATGAEGWFVDDAIPAGSAVIIALVEHRWAIQLRDAISETGGVHLADAWVHPADLAEVGLTVAQN